MMFSKESMVIYVRDFRCKSVVHRLSLTISLSGNERVA